ncbi:MAG TPA: hypothetical protein VFA89_11445 [Terriglobales bacterium]|nr:hypothetical protein [Terriglobales bacterium]
MKFTKRTRPANDKATDFEASWAWRKTSEAFRRRNPMCQVIENGKPCRTKAELVHHLISPGDDANGGWQKRQDWKNLVGICWAHHGPEAGDAERYDYQPTILFDGTEYHHPCVTRKTSAAILPAEKYNALMQDVEGTNAEDLLALIR